MTHMLDRIKARCARKSVIADTAKALVNQEKTVIEAAELRGTIALDCTSAAEPTSPITDKQGQDLQPGDVITDLNGTGSKPGRYLVIERIESDDRVSGFVICSTDRVLIKAKHCMRWNQRNGGAA